MRGPLHAKDMQRCTYRPGTGNDRHPQLTRLDRSGSGYELHLILSLSTNRAASVLGRDLASYRLIGGAVVHVLSSLSFHPMVAIEWLVEPIPAIAAVYDDLFGSYVENVSPAQWLAKDSRLGAMRSWS
jgi:hypothetical protein